MEGGRRAERRKEALHLASYQACKKKGLRVAKCVAEFFESCSLKVGKGRQWSEAPVRWTERRELKKM